MKIEINLKILLMIIILFLLNNLDLYLIFFVFVLIHELAHLILGVLIGGKPKKLYINPLGVSLEIYSYGKNKSLNKILFYLIGPLINFIIALISFYLPISIEIKEKIIYTNLAICFFNLLPILPLDGGKILKEILIVIVRNRVCKYYYDKL